MGWRGSGCYGVIALAVTASVAVLAAGCGQSRPAAGGGAGEQVLVGRPEPLRPSSMSLAQVTAAATASSAPGSRWPGSASPCA
jgi:hypothetical protein